VKPILEIQNISKKFRINHEQEPYLSLRDSISSIFKSKTSQEDFWALKDISFNVMPGDTVGIIGKNGAGKSTLLKILSKITPPTSGKIIGRGRIASLLEVGTGFHPELSGRENVFMNGSILGMRRAEIQKNFDAIVDFSEVTKFIDTPLKHYSSGMQLRLAFSVAAFLEPGILIIDEVLAVGDAEFQKKCLGKMEDVSKSGRTILFVSHNLAAVENLCSNAILLDQGKIVAHGQVDGVVRKYQASHTLQGTSSWERKIKGNELVYFQKIGVSLLGEQPSLKLRVTTRILSQAEHKKAFLAFDISNSMGITIFQAIPELIPFIHYSLNERDIITEILLPPLIPDVYKVSAWMGSHNTETICWNKEVVTFEINESPTQGRNFPHSHHNGFMVPQSSIVNG